MTLLLHAREGLPILQRFLFPLLEMNTDRRRQRKASEQCREMQNPPPPGSTTLRNWERISFHLPPPKALSLLQSQCIPSANPHSLPTWKWSAPVGLQRRCSTEPFTGGRLGVCPLNQRHTNSNDSLESPGPGSSPPAGSGHRQRPLTNACSVLHIFSWAILPTHSHSFTDICCCCLPTEPESTKDPKPVLMK